MITCARWRDNFFPLYLRFFFRRTFLEIFKQFVDLFYALGRAFVINVVNLMSKRNYQEEYVAGSTDVNGAHTFLTKSFFSLLSWNIIFSPVLKLSKTFRRNGPNFFWNFLTSPAHCVSRFCISAWIFLSSEPKWSTFLLNFLMSLYASW